ncbi:hypothetical protein [uncultured Marinobacter sp.]|uniref:RIFT barrel domain-containing protein n=1 Tax=uncultured Marinobacter sp. TaxID=187379 RepID=UPI002636F2CC|nr:hypothetical protein [uncultured Marinobacter sp.]
MDKIAIRLNETVGIARNKEPVSLGIPLPPGAAQSTNQFSLMDGQQPVSVQLVPLAHWPDGSIRWVHASFLVSLDACREKELVLVRLERPSPAEHAPAFNQTIDGLEVETSAGCVHIEPDTLSWHFNSSGSESTQSTVTLHDEMGVPCTAKAESTWKISQNGPVFLAAHLKGQWQKQNEDLLARFDCELRIFLETGLVQVELTTHNPKRARHPGGLWDLGDSGSVYFRELAVITTVPDPSYSKVNPQATDKSPVNFDVTDFNLYQDSSGGENWQSRNHLGSDGEITPQFRGYKFTDAVELRHQDKRANPLITIEYDSGQLNVTVPNFWQNFPSSLRKEGNNLTIGLFPKDAKSAYELQGGERKTLSCLMAHHANNSIHATAYTPLVPVLSPECYERADAFPWFKANSQPSGLDDLIAEGLNGNSNFFAKREIIDEFGWRNFGDIFADHETLYQAEGEPPFISHYNNQYDPIYGFARQFALTGDKRWFQLTDDLARHVVDIDIYHTDEDRAEYNNGLFWHTDHYLDAQTATHRTFSKLNDSSSTPGQTGGGPAEEHCYSTGLLYHYYLTGNDKSRQAVLDLAQWMTALHEGRGGLFEQLLALKRREIRTLKRMIRGEQVTTHRYLFTRGTGNYLNSLLDAWELDVEGPWLERAEFVIRNTIHPADDIELRDLLDVENRWSYLIFLASLSRYLNVKRLFDSEDEHYEYTKASLLHYTDWMLKNERPFMTDVTQLEFPNDTWVAQDLRKAMLMFQASELDPEKSAKYRERGGNWLQEVTEVLQHSKEAHFTRILVILMLIHGPQTLATDKCLSCSGTTSVTGHWPRPVLTWRQLSSRIVTRVLRAIKTFKPSRERIWLNTRLDRS